MELSRMKNPAVLLAGGLFTGAILTVIAEVVVAYLVVRAGALPANADAKPPQIETWIARTSLSAAIRREAPKDDNPLPASDANLLAGMHSYIANCAVCHGVADGKATNVAAGLYQRPPQFAAHGVEDDPGGFTYWKISHGIRLTGMPSYASSLTRRQIWQVTAFLAHMDQLPTAVQTQWRKARVAETIAPAAMQRQDRGPTTRF
jgi:thiosulfate dehydrogenase